MKTARKKAEEFLMEMAVGNWEWNEMVDKLSIAFKVQDRDTRHACADAINSSDRVFEKSSFNLAMTLYDAESIIMNTRAV